MAKGNELTLVVGKSRRQFAEEIGRAWQKSVENIIETGRLIAQAKNGLQHGEFMAMVETDLPFKVHTADRLMAIAANPVLSNCAHALNLPPSWMTLYQLTRLPERVLEEKIADGTINPGMERKDVADLIRPPSERPQKLPGGPHADCIQLEHLARRWDDHAVAAAIQWVMMAGFKPTDSPRGAESAANAPYTLMELKRWAEKIEQGTMSR
jgi:Protein of unknown function (DUF3102)